MAELRGDEDNESTQPSTSSPASQCRESPGRSPLCPACGSTPMLSPALNPDSHVFSRVLVIAISRMSMIARQTAEESKWLSEDDEAMAGIRENVCLMKSTIKYLLRHEFTCDDDSGHDRRSGSREEEQEEADVREDDDIDGNGNCSSCRSSIADVIEEKDQPVTVTISKGLVGGITTMAAIAKDTSEVKNVLLADDKDALAEMLDIVLKLKMLII